MLILSADVLNYSESLVGFTCAEVISISRCSECKASFTGGSSTVGYDKVCNE